MLDQYWSDIGLISNRYRFNIEQISGHLADVGQTSVQYWPNIKLILHIYRANVVAMLAKYRYVSWQHVGLTSVLRRFDIQPILTGHHIDIAVATKTISPG